MTDSNRDISNSKAPLNSRVPDTRNYSIVTGQTDAVFGIKQVKPNTNTIDSDGAFETKGANDYVGWITVAGRNKKRNDPDTANLTFVADADGITVWCVVPTSFSTALKDIDPNRPKTCFYDVWPSDDGSTKTGTVKQRGSIFVRYSVNDNSS